MKTKNNSRKEIFKNYGKRKRQPAKKHNINSDKKRKNGKFILRGKGMTEDHRKQKDIEEKYHVKSHDNTYDDYLGIPLADLDYNPLENEVDEYDELVSSLQRNAKSKSYESDDSSTESINEVLSDFEYHSDVAANIANDNERQQIDNEIYIRSDDGEESDGVEKDGTIMNNDTFSIHLDHELDPTHVEDLLSVSLEIKKSCLKWPNLGVLSFEYPNTTSKNEWNHSIKLCDPKSFKVANDFISAGVKSSLVANTQLPLNFMQSEIFSILNIYKDFYFPQRTLKNAEELRFIWCLHVLNHMLKTRSRILHHSAKLKTAERNKSESAILVPDSCRDQGLVRPKVLILAPFRESAFRTVNMMAKLLHGDHLEQLQKNNSIMNYDRFVNEYTGSTLYFPKTNAKPIDYEQTFSGNTDDNFRIGISLTKKCLKLYTDFYASDILIASPLGLRMIIGAAGSKDRDYDFLNSIEVLVIDQAEVLYAQNWENLLHVIDHLHLQPQSLRDTDFQRVRQWCLSGLSRFYRQTVLLSSHDLPEFRSLFNHKCVNYEGKVRVTNPIVHGEIRNVCVTTPQLFHKINVSSLDRCFDERFKYFTNEILPRFMAPSFAHTLIYVPSYFDYVRLRNYFKAEAINFVQICEYTKDAKISRARDMFFHSGARFLLYSERAHFFRRTRIKGIRHMIMYQPAQWPHLYSEMVNLMQEANQNRHDGLENDMSITILYTKYDLLRLNTILNSETAMKLMKSTKVIHAFSTET